MSREEVPRYTASTACAVANIKPPTLRAWRNLGWFHQEAEKSPGQWTLYSYLDLCVLRCAAVLIEQGISGNIAVPIAGQLGPSFSTCAEGSRIAMAAVYYPPHAEKGPLAAETIRVRNIAGHDDVLRFYPNADDEARAFVIVDVLRISNDVLEGLVELGNPSVLTAEETRRMILQTAAEVISPRDDDGRDGNTD